MNEPHVVALIYRVGHSDEVDYKDAAPLEFETDAFKVHIADGSAFFETSPDLSRETGASGLWIWEGRVAAAT
jgi:hypothetical protein